MVNFINIQEALELQLPIIDVRSPSEHEKGHIPNSHNISLFSNEERAHVGTVYKQQSKEAAIELGYIYVNPKLDLYIQEAKKVAPKGSVIVHCWRGGMRSQSFAEHLMVNGFDDVKVIEGGYKAFRNFVLNYFKISFPLKIIGGYTGSGKTEILHDLQKQGEQVIDLEALANHKGSAFGGIGQGEQPSVEQFENNLYVQLSQLDLNRTIWLEDESHNIGKVILPNSLFHQMQNAEVLFLEIPKEERAKHLVAGYADCGDEFLKDGIHRIEKRLGGLRTQQAIEYLKDKDYHNVALMTLNYYDKYYLLGIQKKTASKIKTLKLSSTNHHKNALQILKNIKEMENIKLTSYSHGAGCGCKISPALLSEMLQTNQPQVLDKNIIVGNSTRDDAAVYDLGDGNGIITTTDFFMPIVDDPFTFGQIAATNAISDIFAMGGQPIMSIAIFGWPIDKLSAEVAREVLAGGREVCSRVGSPLVGGHSIDSPEPIFGLAVTGKIYLKHLKRNDSATQGCKLYLTKPLGVGILSTAGKQGKIDEKDKDIAAKSMTTLNSIGFELGKIEGVKAMTDVTGFGLLGHLVEMCEGSRLSAEVKFDKVPVFDEVHKYIEQGCIPGGTYRNWKSYGHHTSLKDERYKEILCDPQTSGGLLIAVEDGEHLKVEQLLNENGLQAVSIGEMKAQGDTLINVV